MNNTETTEQPTTHRVSGSALMRLVRWCWWAVVTLVLFAPAMSVLILQRCAQYIGDCLLLLYYEICDINHKYASPPEPSDSKYDEDI